MLCGFRGEDKRSNQIEYMGCGVHHESSLWLFGVELFTE